MITRIGLIFNLSLKILGFIILASICCADIIIIASHTAFEIPPVHNVINIAIPTAIIAPKNGIKLNIPIIVPNYKNRGKKLSEERIKAQFDNLRYLISFCLIFFILFFLDVGLLIR